MLKRLFALTLLCVSVNSFAETIRRLPNEIYQPYRATLLKAKAGRNDLTATFHMRGANVPRFSRDLIAHARKHGFRVVNANITAEEAEIDLVRGNRSMEVSVDLVDATSMKYRIELEQK